LRPKAEVLKLFDPQVWLGALLPAVDDFIAAAERSRTSYSGDQSVSLSEKP
jgi:hypothetical protein